MELGKIEIIDFDEFVSEYRCDYKLYYSDKAYINYLKANQKLYDDFTNEIFSVNIVRLIDYSDVKTVSKLIEIYKKHLSPTVYTNLWGKLNVSLFKLIIDDKTEAERYIYEELVPPIIEMITHYFNDSCNKIIDYLEDEIFKLEVIKKEITEKNTIDNLEDKIQIRGNYQMLAFLFNELINKGFIIAPQHNGKNSHKRTAEMILKHFQFIDKMEQPNIDNLADYLKRDRYSLEKRGFWRIPYLKQASD